MLDVQAVRPWRGAAPKVSITARYHNIGGAMLFP